MTLTSLQLLLNQMAENGYRKSTVGQIRTYIKACFQYAADEDLIPKNPARKLVMPNIRKKSCERFLSIDEVRALLRLASPREHVILRVLGMRIATRRGLGAAHRRFRGYPTSNRRSAQGTSERGRPDRRTKTDESNNFVPVPPDLGREIAAWIAAHPGRISPRAFLFPNSSGNPFSVGNYLKRYLKPLGEKAGIHDLTHQVFRRTSSTHMQSHATVKDMQRHLRHTDPQTTLKSLRESHPREFACRSRCSGRTDYRDVERCLVARVGS